MLAGLWMSRRHRAFVVIVVVILRLLAIHLVRLSAVVIVLCVVLVVVCRDGCIRHLLVETRGGHG